jgi:aminoglycoside 3-N-acetyltransferase I
VDKKMIETSYQNILFKQLQSDPEGLKHLRKLNEVFAAAFDETDTYLGKKPSDDYLLSLLSRDHMLVCVALDKERVVAGLVAYVLEKFEQERSEVYIYDLAVDENFRRQKIATRLIHFLKDEAAKRGAWVVYVQADRDDPPAIQLYESLGVREDVCHFDISMDSAV